MKIKEKHQDKIYCIHWNGDIHGEHFVEFIDTNQLNPEINHEDALFYKSLKKALESDDKVAYHRYGFSDVSHARPQKPHLVHDQVLFVLI